MGETGGAVQKITGRGQAGGVGRDPPPSKKFGAGGNPFSRVSKAFTSAPTTASSSKSTSASGNGSSSTGARK